MNLLQPVKTPICFMQAAQSVKTEKNDCIVPCNEESGQMMEDAFLNYDAYDGTAFISRESPGRKTKFVPGSTDYLMAHPHE